MASFGFPAEHVLRSYQFLFTIIHIRESRRRRHASGQRHDLFLVQLSHYVKVPNVVAYTIPSGCRVREIRSLFLVYTS